jgi:diguanylate cyclase (GGDEF)-like protein
MLELIRQLQLNQHVKKFENKVRSKNGQESIYLWNDQIIQSPTSDELIVVSFGVNISYEKEMEKRALDLAYTDRLTGFKNRTSFENDVADLIHNHYEFSIFYLDFDRFRTLNDTHGHKYGDLFLKMYSEALRKTFSKNRLYRWCGDEFLIVFDSRDTNEVLNLLYLQQIFELTHKKWQFEHVTYYPTVSIGTARFPADADNISDLLKNLDIALHKAKSLGKGNFIAFDKIFLEESERILNIEHKINQAIEDNQFRLVYQPIYNLQNKSIRAFEILLRWDQEENLTTGELIEIAERTGQIVKIDQWVIQNAFQSIAKYKFNEQILISINLSGQTFNSREILDYIDEKLTENNINPQRIEFEVTEHSIIQDFNYAVEMIELLRKKRFRIALDDFGTRYSSLNYLSRLPLDVLKIDKSYVDYITQNNNDSMVVEHLIQLSTKLNLNTIAEGIETKEQELLLEKIGCQMGQGYLFSKPVDIEKAVEMSNK